MNGQVFIEKKLLLQLVEITIKTILLKKPEVYKTRNAISKKVFNSQLAEILGIQVSTLGNYKIPTYYQPNAPAELKALKGENISSKNLKKFCAAIDRFIKDNALKESATDYIASFNHLKTEVYKKIAFLDTRKKNEKRVSKKDTQKQTGTANEQSLPSATADNSGFLKSLENTGWIFFDELDTNSEFRKLLTFLQSDNPSTLSAKLQLIHIDDIWNNDTFDRVFRSQSSKVKKKSKPHESTQTQYWIGEAKFHKEDKLLSVQLFWSNKNQIKLELVFKGNAIDVNYCMGHMLTVNAENKNIKSQIIVLLRNSPEFLNDELLRLNMIDSVYAKQEEFKKITSQYQEVPLNPIVENGSSLQFYLTLKNIKRVFNKSIEGEYLLFYNSNNTEIKAKDLNIKIRETGSPIVTLNYYQPGVAKINGPLKWEGYIKDQFQVLEVDLFHETPVHSMYRNANSVKLLFNYNNFLQPDEEINILSGSLFGNFLYGDELISSFFLAVKTKFLHKINRTIITHIILNHKIGDKINKHDHKEKSKTLEIKNIYELWELYPEIKKATQADNLNDDRRGWKIPL